jgi:hypothetical protein
VAWIGYYQFGGTEIINVSRTNTYVRNGHVAWFRECVDCDMLPMHIGDEPYTTPWDDDAPWIDPDDPATYGFWGVYPLDVSGIESATTTAMVTESVLDGGVVGRIRRATKTIVFNALLLGQDECSVEAGFRWLKAVLSGGVCSSGSSDCGGSDLCYLNCDPCTMPSECREVPPITWPMGEGRSLRDVTVTVGPVITARQNTTDGTVIWTVTWTAVAANPFEYGEEVPVIEGFLDPAVDVPFTGGVVPPGGSFDTIGHDDTEVACPVPTYQPVQDPACSFITLPPTAASVTLNCFVPYDDFHRYQYVLPEQYVPNWGVVVPRFEVHAVNGAVRQLRIRFYTDQLGSGDPSLDPCNYCGDLVVSYIPQGATLVIDGADQSTYVITAGDVRQRSNHLLFSSDGSPFEWPELTCGTGYIVTVDTLDDQAPPTLNMSLYQRVA